MKAFAQQRNRPQAGGSTGLARARVSSAWPRGEMTSQFAHDFSGLPVYARMSGNTELPPVNREAREGYGTADNFHCNAAGKPGAPPRAEDRMEGIFGNGKPAANAGKTKHRVAASPPKLSKKTVSPLTTGNCGHADWVVQWELDKKTAIGGWVVQNVELPYDVKDCGNKAIDPTKRNGPQPSKFPFWEAWQIHKNQRVTTYAEKGDFKDDEFELVSPGNDTKGSITVNGAAEFYEGLTLPKSFTVTHKPPAYSLPSTTSKPTLTGGTGAIPHILKAAWDCCTKGKGATQSTKASTT